MDTKNSYTSEYIERRHRGEDVLSWIEQFGIHFLEDGKNGYKGKPNAGDHFLVLRICSAKGKKEDTIYAHHCFFKTDKEGATTFCVNGICHYSTEKLRELFEKAKWKENNTKNWWSEVFRNNGFQDIDDVLCRPEVVVSDSYKELSMQDFLKQIQEVIENAIKSLDLGTTKITKVCIVEQYAKALPLRHALYKMFPNRYMYTYVFTREMPMNNYGWQLKADKFLVPAKLMNTKLNTSPQMTIGDVLQLGEKGIVLTLPFSKYNEKHDDSCFPNSPVFDGVNLKWKDLMPDEVMYDYHVGDLLSLKRIHLSIQADGFQNVYIKIANNEAITCISSNGDVIPLKTKGKSPLYHKPSTATQCQDHEKAAAGLTPNEMVYIIDTNVFIDEPEVLSYIDNQHKIGVAPTLIDELDKKKRDEKLKNQVIKAQKNIRKELEKNRNRIIYKSPNLKLLGGLDYNNPDNRILALALTLKEENYSPIMLTSDNGLMLSAKLKQIETITLKELKNTKKK